MAKLVGSRDYPLHAQGKAYAPANIALCKYWGKRDDTLNLPRTPSLSVSLGPLGAETSIRTIEDSSDRFLLNGNPIPQGDPAYERVVEYLDLFRPCPEVRFETASATSVPVGAGVASSAAGFAALAMALDNLFAWKLDRRELSILARLGSGSACRSVFSGFAEWRAGERKDGLDSYAELLDTKWPALCIGLLQVSGKQKHIGSREAMKRTVQTSKFYARWPDRVALDIQEIKAGLTIHDIEQMGQAAEANALAMHATMLDSRPPVLYWKAGTVAAIHKVWAVRNAGVPVYFTIDAGPNLKLLFEESVRKIIEQELAPTRIVKPFETYSHRQS